MSKSSSNVSIGSVTNSTFAIGPGATVVNGQVVSGGDDDERDGDR